MSLQKLNWFLLLAILGMPSFNAMAKNERIVCDDHTFAYNAAKIEAVDDGYEITVTGSTLYGDPVTTINDFKYVLIKNNNQDVWNPNMAVYIKLPKSACRIDADAITATCDHMFANNEMFNAAFANVWVSDIDENMVNHIVRIISSRSKSFFNNVSFAASREGVHVFLKGSEDQSPQEISVLPRVVGTTNKLTCGSAPRFINPIFPDRLRDYLRSH